MQSDLANLQKKKDEEKALKELRAKAQQKGSFGGAGLKKSGKKWEGYQNPLVGVQYIFSWAVIINTIVRTSFNLCDGLVSNVLLDAWVTFSV